MTGAMQKCAMLQARQHKWVWLLVWCALTVLGGAVLARLALTQLREDFETDARIAHRLLSQRVVQHDAVMATLALLQSPRDAAGQTPEQRLSAVYPQILAVQRRDPGRAWPQGGLGEAEAQSRQRQHAVLANADLAAGRYQLVLGADPASYALLIDLRDTVPWSEWPMTPDSSPVRVTLDHAGQQFVIQPGQLQGGGWRFDFRKTLAADSQPFDVVAVRQVGWQALPWGQCLAWAATVAAGMAHELNQPLTAVLANTQAASRLLADDPPELDTARSAMTQAVEQARRAANVVARLRRVVERPELAGQVQPVLLQDTVRNALYLLEPECSRRSVRPVVEASLPLLAVLAEPVALEQIIHNLLMNALQALEQVSPAERQLTLVINAQQGRGVLRVRDTGPGLCAELLARMFEPFFTTREAGLGLGLSLCETLAQGMGGTLSAHALQPRGAELRLSLPLAFAHYETN